MDADTLALDDLDLSELTAEFEAEAAPEEGLEPASEVSVTLDLEDSTGLNEVGSIELPDPIQLSDIEGLDIDLPKAEPESVAKGADDTVSDSLDLDGMMAEAEAAVDGGDSILNADSEFSADELQAQLDELSDLSILDSELDEATTSQMIEPLPGIEAVSEEVGGGDESQVDQPFNLDEAFDVAEAGDEGEEILEMGEVAAVPEPVDEDEVATKLDLARAYVEMGDEDGARAILAEVAAEGSQAHRGDAENLLSQLG
jgi:pilus assembly protein FimV